MAITKVPVELSSTPGIVDNSNATAITIDSSERVSIATATNGLLFPASHSKTKIGLYGATGTGAEFIGTQSNSMTISGANIDFFGAAGSGTPNIKMNGTTIIDTSRNLTNIGTISSGDITITSAGAAISLVDSDNNPDYQIKNGNGSFRIIDTTNSADRININSSGNVGIGTTSPQSKLETNLHSGADSSLMNANSVNDVHLIRAGFGQNAASTTNAGAKWGLRFVGRNDNNYDNQKSGAIFAVSEDSLGYNRKVGLAFHTSSHDASHAERMRINADGNVGIGTTSPNSPLEIVKNITFTNSDTFPQLLIKTTATTTGNQLGLGVDETDNVAFIEAIDRGTNVIPLVLQRNGGRVGLGTDSPQEKLHVVGQASLQNAGNTNRGNIILGAHGSGTSKWSTLAGTHYNDATGSGNGTGSAGCMIIGCHATSGSNEVYVGGGPYELNPATAVRFYTHSSDLHGLGGSERMRIDSSGHVGIGVNTVSSANAAADDFVIKGPGTTAVGMTISNSSDAGTGTIFFGDASSSTAAGFRYNHNTGDLAVSAEDNVTFTCDNVGIGTTSPDTKLHVFKASAGSITDYSNNGLIVENNTDVGISMHTPNANAGHLMFSSPGHQYHSYIRGGYGAGNTSTLKFFTDGLNTMTHKYGKVGIGTDAPGHKVHVHGGSAHTNLVISTADGYKSELRMMEDAAGTTHGGFIRYDGNGDYVRLGTYNGGTESVSLTIKDDGKVGIGTDDPKSTLQVEGGRMGIISTASSWEQLRIANSNVAEVGIALLNGATNTEFLSDNIPSFSNAFTLAINPYGVGTDTLAIAHGNLGDSIWHIDGSGNFGYGPNTENPVSYYEISKTRPNTSQPSDHELKLTLNTYGYVGSNYKLGMLQFLGGDTASAQDNFYAGIGSTALTGTNNSEEGSLDFHVKNTAQAETLAVQIVGKAGTTLAGSGQHAKGVLFRYQGIAIDRVWQGYPGISVLNGSDYSSTASTQAEFRFHGTNSSSAAYPGTSGSDFSVDVRTDGSYVTGSDRRRKTNITTISNALTKVKQLTGKRFQTINRQSEINKNRSMADDYEFGFIAQEIESIIPESLKYNADEDDGTENWNSAYSMNYASVVPLLVNAIKEQDTIIQDLKSRIETLEG